MLTSFILIELLIFIVALLIIILGCLYITVMLVKKLCVTFKLYVVPDYKVGTEVYYIQDLHIVAGRIAKIKVEYCINDSRRCYYKFQNNDRWVNARNVNINNYKLIKKVKQYGHTDKSR